MDYYPSEPYLSPNDPYRLTIAELNTGYDDDELWGLYLYKKHTQQCRIPISSEMAATMSTRDLEALIYYLSVSASDFEHDRNAVETIQRCCYELALRDTQQGKPV